MTNTIRKIASVLLIAAMVIAFIPATGVQQLAYADDNAAFQVTYDSGKVTGTWNKQTTAGTVDFLFQLQIYYDGTWQDVPGYVDGHNEQSYSKSVSFSIEVPTAGKYRVKATENDGDPYYSNEFAVTVDISEADIDTIPQQVYSGTPLTPTVHVTLNKNDLVEGTDYTVAYSNNAGAGDATVTITGIGNYTGTKTTTFNIYEEYVPEERQMDATLRLVENAKTGVVGKTSFYVYGTWGSYGYDAKNKKIELLRKKNGTSSFKVVDSAEEFLTNALTLTSHVSYNKNDKFKVRISCTLDGKKYSAESKVYTVQSEKLKKTSLDVAKVNSNHAVAVWDPVIGATGYKVYYNGKLKKTVGKSTYRYVLKASKAGSGKFQVSPIVKLEGKTYEGPKSSKMKPSANSFNTGRSTYYDDYKWMTCPFVVTSVKLSGSKYTITGYAVNNRILKMKKYSSLKLTVYSNGKSVASKTFKNVKVNVGGYSSKKLTFTISGKSAQEIRCTGDCISVVRPVW